MHAAEQCEVFRRSLAKDTAKSQEAEYQKWWPRLNRTLLRKSRGETPIERIYLEVTGRKMPEHIKSILLRKRRAKAKTS